MSQLQKGFAGRRQSGSTLVEVLVSILVLAVGMLGAAGLQMTGMRNSQGSYERTQMTVLMQSMLDAMRNNVAAVDAGQYEYAAWTCTAPVNTNLASADVGTWVTNLKSQLNPSACARITCNARDCTLGVRWDDSRSRGGDTAQVMNLRSTL